MRGIVYRMNSKGRKTEPWETGKGIQGREIIIIFNIINRLEPTKTSPYVIFCLPNPNLQILTITLNFNPALILNDTGHVTWTDQRIVHNY